jgi:hypothetical protein
MHPDLSPHLHTNECNTFTFEYKDCTEKVRDCHYENYFLIIIVGLIHIIFSIDLTFSAQIFKISWKV